MPEREDPSKLNRASMYANLMDVNDIDIRPTVDGHIHIQSKRARLSVIMSTEVWSLIEYKVREGKLRLSYNKIK